VSGTAPDPRADPRPGAVERLEADPPGVDPLEDGDVRRIGRYRLPGSPARWPRPGG